MRNSTSLVVIMALLTASVSAGTYFIDNFCPFPVYLQSSSTPAGCPVPPLTLPANTSNAYMEIMRDGNYSSNALTISQTPDLATPMQAIYYQEENLNFFALSTMIGDPLSYEGFQLLRHKYGPGLDCPPRSSIQTCPYTYTGHQIYAQDKKWNLRLSLCQFNQTGTADAA
jgi:hypothetical protein